MPHAASGKSAAISDMRDKLLIERGALLDRLGQEMDEARHQRDEHAATAEQWRAKAIQRGTFALVEVKRREAMEEQLERLTEAAGRVRNGEGIRSTGEYIRWLLQHHPAALAADEASSHAERLEEVAQSMDAIGLMLSGPGSTPAGLAVQGEALLVDVLSTELEEWRALALQLIALALFARAQWLHMLDLWTRASSEVAAMRLALEAQERAEGRLPADAARGPLLREAERLRGAALSTSRPYMAAVPVSWVRHVLMHGYPGITGDMVNDVIRTLERAMENGGPPVSSNHKGMRWARVCPDCHHTAHQPGQCSEQVRGLVANGGGPCMCQTRVTL